MKLIVGLGNPGRKYEATRHNIGFVVAQRLAARWNQPRGRARFHGETVETRVGEHQVMLLCPHTWMNRSGLSVLEARVFFKLDLADLLVICDDFNLPLAKLRCRPKGSSGGQKGLQDILNRLGTDEVPRLRVGIGAPPDGWDVAAYVLSRFHPEEVDVIQSAAERAADAALDWVREGIEFCMNRYNADPASGDEHRAV